MSQPYLELVAMADEELALAVAGRWEELPAAIERRAERARALPAVPPRDARPLLERLARMQSELDSLLRTARDATAVELGRLDRGRGAVRGYQTAGALAGARVDGAA